VDDAPGRDCAHVLVDAGRASFPDPWSTKRNPRFAQLVERPGLAIAALNGRGASRRVEVVRQTRLIDSESGTRIPTAEHRTPSREKSGAAAEELLSLLLPTAWLVQTVELQGNHDQILADFEAHFTFVNLATALPMVRHAINQGASRQQVIDLIKGISGKPRSGLTIFAKVPSGDLGGFLAGDDRRGTRYDVGNLVTAAEFAAADVRSAGFAPVTVFFSKGPASTKTLLQFITPKSLFVTVSDEPEVRRIATRLTQELQAVIDDLKDRY
jgi:hypothetical protein